MNHRGLATTVSSLPVSLELRQALLDLLERIVRALVEAREDPQPVHAVAGRIRQNTFDIVIVGQYKRGKTTFINALLGEDLLPTAVVPLTSIATRIFYGPRVAACVRFLDGRTQEIPVADLYLYTTEKGNPGNIKGVVLAEVSRGMAEKLNMQCGRLRHDFVRRIQDRVQEFTAAMDEHFHRAITSIRDVVERSLVLRRNREEAAAAARAEVTGRLAEVAEMESRLAAVVARIEGDGT